MRLLLRYFCGFFFLWAWTACGDAGAGGAGHQMMSVNVVVAQASEEQISDQLSLVGTLAANEAVEIQSEIDGIVEQINFAEGQKVEKDSLLFKIDAEKLSAEVAQAEANFKLTQANMKRSETLFRKKTISSQEYDSVLSAFRASTATLELARQRLGDATILAPFSGIMGARHISPGQLVSKGEALSSIVNIDPIKLEFRVPERHISRLHTGLTANVQVDAFPDQVFTAQVYFISPRLDEQTRTLLTKARISNTRELLKPGMFANVDIVFGTQKKALMIPESALVIQQGLTHVFLVKEDKTVSLREVELGLRAKGKVQISKGLNSGNLVVAEGTQKIRDGAQVEFPNTAQDQAPNGQEGP